MNRQNIEDIYELSPLQQGMLFHTLRDPDSAAYLEQLRFRIEGELDAARFREQWTRAMRRHAALRTALYWEKLEKPYQVVHRSAEIRWEELDWRDVPEPRAGERFQQFLKADLKRGFALNQPPLMRFSLIRVADRAYQFVWTFHHTILDGWSLGILLKEIAAGYASPGAPESVATVPKPYRDYLLWIQSQDLAQSEAYWRRQLAGFTMPTPLMEDFSPDANSPLSHNYERRRIELSEAATADLQAAARKLRLTLNTILQGAWGLLLGRRSTQQDVVWGTVVSGRPPDLPESDTIVGMMINTLPVRARIDPESTLRTWLAALQDQLSDHRQYEFNSLIQIRNWSDIAAGKPLFHSIFVFENYPIDASVRQLAPGTVIRDACIFEQSNYPLSVVAVAGKQLAVEMI
jgi:hypothetical protein